MLPQWDPQRVEVLVFDAAYPGYMTPFMPHYHERIRTMSSSAQLLAEFALMEVETSSWVSIIY